MDPKAALMGLARALGEVDIDNAIMFAESLQEWFARDGFVPDMTPSEMADLMDGIRETLGELDL